MAALIHDAMLSASVRAAGRTPLATGARPATPSNQTESKPELQKESTENKKAPTEAELQKSVQDANIAFAGSSQKISFIYEKRINQMFVQIVDKASGEVIKEVPPREFIEHKVAMHEFIGLLLDKKG